MTPCMLKVTGLSGEVEHFINLNRCNRIDLKKISNCSAYNFYAHYDDGDISIVISHLEASNARQALEAWT